MKTKELFTAPQVAKICSTDLKTIHNWVNRGEMKFFRTPGRHLRFRRVDVLQFLRKFGYPIPPELSDIKSIVVVIDPDESAGNAIAAGADQSIEVRAFSDHLDALIQIGKIEPTLVAVNGSISSEMLKVAENIKKNEEGVKVLVYGTPTVEMRELSEDFEILPSSETSNICNRLFSMVNDQMRQAG